MKEVQAKHFLQIVFFFFSLKICSIALILYMDEEEKIGEGF